MPTYSRRSVLFGFGAAVGLASLPRHAFAALDGTPFTFLTDPEARSLALLCDTLIPQDDFPSASQAGVVDFIDLSWWPSFNVADVLLTVGVAISLLASLRSAENPTTLD